MRKLICIFSIVILCACQSKKGKLTFYIHNGSRVDTLINFKVSINGSLKIDTLFKYSTIVPNDDTFIVDESIKDSISISGLKSSASKSVGQSVFDVLN